MTSLFSNTFSGYASYLDVFGIFSGNSGIKFGDILLGLDQTFVLSQERGVFDFRETALGEREFLTVLDLSRNDICYDCEHVLYFIHGGSFVTGNLYSVQHPIMAAAAANKIPIVSVDYPLNRFANTNPAAVRESLDASLNFTAHKFPNSKIIVSGVSAGGTLAIDLVNRTFNESNPIASRVVGLYVDSPNICLETVQEQIKNSEDRMCWRDDTNVDTPLFPIASYKTKNFCFDDWSPPVPTHLMIPNNDIIIPVANYYPWAEKGEKSGRKGNITFCRDGFGIHGFALSLFGGCVQDAVDFFEEVGSDVTKTDMETSLAIFNMQQTMGFAVMEMAIQLNMLSIVCRFLCSPASDPYDRYAYDCSPDTKYPFS